jgi:hypothetical protein
MLVGENNGDWGSLFQFDDGIVGIGESEAEFSTGHTFGHLFVSGNHRRDLRQLPEILFKFFGAPDRSEYRSVGRGCSKKWFGDRSWGGPLGIHEIHD